MRAQAACRTVVLKVPEASVTTNTSKPSTSADKVENATHTSVTTPAMMICLRPVALIALTIVGAYKPSWVLAQSFGRTLSTPGYF